MISLADGQKQIFFSAWMNEWLSDIESHCAVLVRSLTASAALRKMRSVHEQQGCGLDWPRTGNVLERQKAGCMYRRVKNSIGSAIASIALLGCLVTSPGYAQVANGQKIETKGLILTRDGEHLSVETKDMGNLIVVLNENTKVQVPKGIFRHKEMEVTSLVPGLDIELKGIGGENGQVVADTIEFSENSLRVAKQVHAGMTATKAQAEANKEDISKNERGISANKEKIGTNAADIAQHTEEIKTVEKRFSDLTEYDIKKSLSINFETGKSDLSDDAKQQLTVLAQEAQGMKGSLIQVKGFASTSGGAQLNQQLSEERAETVVTFLQQQGVPLQHIVTPAAMGITSPVAPNDTPEGRLQNQRVEVQILVNRGLAPK